MVLRLIAHIVTGILITGFVVWLVASITDAAWKSLQRRAATRRAAEKLLASWSALADAQREQLAPEGWKAKRYAGNLNRHDSHLHVVRDEEPS